MKEYFNPTVYLICSQRNGTLYIGVTSNLCNRIAEHKHGAISGFSKQHRVKTLVWFQEYDSMPEAIKHEKRMKEWQRKWKIELIEKSNPDWHDLYPETCENAERYFPPHTPR